MAIGSNAHLNNCFVFQKLNRTMYYALIFSVVIFGKLPPKSGIGARSRFFIAVREVTVAGARATRS